MNSLWLILDGNWKIVVVFMVVGMFLLMKFLLDKLKIIVKEIGVEGCIVNVLFEVYKYGYKGGFVFDKFNDLIRYFNMMF